MTMWDIISEIRYSPATRRRSSAIGARGRCAVTGHKGGTFCDSGPAIGDHVKRDCGGCDHKWGTSLYVPLQRFWLFELSLPASDEPGPGTFPQSSETIDGTSPANESSLKHSAILPRITATGRPGAHSGGFEVHAHTAAQGGREVNQGIERKPRYPSAE